MDLALTISRRSSDAPPADTGGTRALTERLARGDESALGELYERWFDRMVGMAMAATGRDESFCMDAAQDAFVKLIRHPKSIADDRALGAYLRRMVVTSAYDRLRAERRRFARENSRAGAEQRAEQRDGELIATLERAIASLEKEQGEMLIARYKAGWTLASIGERLGLATGAVDGRIGRLVRSLRKQLADEDGGER